MSAAIDMLATARNSEATGNSANRTDAIVSAIGNVRGPVATKEYSDADWAALRAHLRAEFAGVRAHLRSEFADVHADIVKLRKDLCKAIWIQGAVLAIIILACEFL